MKIVHFQPGDGSQYYVLAHALEPSERGNPDDAFLSGFGSESDSPYRFAVFERHDGAMWEADFQGLLRIGSPWMVTAALLVFSEVTGRPVAGINYERTAASVLALWRREWRDDLAGLKSEIQMVDAVETLRSLA